ncbi:MAG: hypothetical protein B6D55_00110 [Candidatus Omnitrophica bacterium 4484_70.2]|nr:MAG: hypothetical protein B6D55_00110 [Candidatus Omnitrophica bacterium 4484_70.2]
MNFQQKLENNNFVYTVEVEPPKGVMVEDTLKELVSLRDIIDAFNVTDMQASVMRASSWALAAKLKEKRLEPILQLAARDRNIIALQGDLLASFILGIKNLLLLTGDTPKKGDHPSAKEVFEVDSIGLIKIAHRLNQGFDYMGNKLKGKPQFFIGAALNPLAQNIDKELKKMEEKIKAGASFFQTQPVFDIEGFYRFMKKAKRFKTKIIAGIMFLKSARMANYLYKKIGIYIPSSYRERLEKAKDIKEEIVKMSSQLIDDLKDIADGIHFMPLGNYPLIKRILK